MILNLLVYRSRSTNQLSTDDIFTMSKNFACKNRENDITGILFFDGHCFLQILEGPQDKIIELFKLIQTDSRHEQVITILNETINRRTFDEWGMGLIVIDDIEHKKNVISNDFIFDERFLKLGLDDLCLIDQKSASMIIDAFPKGYWREPYSIPFEKFYDKQTNDIFSQFNKRQNACNYPVNFAFQPIVNPISKQVISVEALLRGAGDELPSSILSRYSGTELYRFDLESKQYALQIAADMRLPCRISLNLLPMSLIIIPDAADFLLKKIEYYGFSSEQIIIEVTEKETIDNYDSFIAAIKRFQAADIKVAIDDFGSGYAGLTLLSEFQPDNIKIDRKLIKGIQFNHAKQAIVLAIVNCCHSLGISVIAEGVEEAAEVDWLLEAGVNKFQGFYFARPALNSFPKINW